MIQPSASSGQTSWSSSVSKSTNSPIVRWPLITWRPPKKTTAAIESDGQVVQPGQVARLDAGLAQHRVAHGLAPCSPKRPAHLRLAAERLHHLDADDGLVGRLRHVALALPAPGARAASPGARSPSASTVIGGMATAV